MNNHSYRAPQCTWERIRKRKRKKEDTYVYIYMYMYEHSEHTQHHMYMYMYMYALHNDYRTCSWGTHLSVEPVLMGGLLAYFSDDVLKIRQVSVEEVFESVLLGGFVLLIECCEYSVPVRGLQWNSEYMYLLVYSLCSKLNDTYIHVHVCTCIMNNHLYRAPQCTKERIRKRKKTNKHTSTRTTMPFPPHAQQPQWLRNYTTLPTASLAYKIACNSLNGLENL